MMGEEIPKSFGFPDAQGFYSIHSSNSLALDTARQVVAVLPDKLEYMALAGYLSGHDDPQDNFNLDKMFDDFAAVFDREVNLRYHLLIGIDPKLPMHERDDLIFFDLKDAVKTAYTKAREDSGNYWHHGPLKTVSLDDWGLKNRTEYLKPCGFIHSLVFSAVPLWEKPGLVKKWKNYIVTPFEYLQQFVFQFHREKPVQRKFFISTVTGDEAERLILD